MSPVARYPGGSRESESRGWGVEELRLECWRVGGFDTGMLSMWRWREAVVGEARGWPFGFSVTEDS